MFRPSPTARLLRQSIKASKSSYKSTPSSSRRFITTEPPHKKSRSWKNSAARWSLAIGGIYWYNTSPVFAEEPQYTVQGQEAPLPTLESLSRSARFSLPSENDLPVLPVQPSHSSPSSIDPKSSVPSSSQQQSPEAGSSPADLEAEAASQGAFNEETGEINWDCPCLGGMAHGPCGLEFRAAFECFVFSKDEPKGMDCVDKFKGMQTCFRAHPEEYGDQLEEDEDDVERELAEQIRDREKVKNDEGGEGVTGAEGAGVAMAVKEVAKEGGAGTDVKNATAGKDKKSDKTLSKKSMYDGDEQDGTSQSLRSDSRSQDSKTSGVNEQKIDLAGDEEGNLVPKAAHDATGETASTKK